MILEMITFAELGLGAIAVLLALRYGTTYASVVSSYASLRSKLQRCEDEKKELRKELDEVYRLSSFGKVLMDALKKNKIRIVPVGEKCEHVEVVPGKILCVRKDKVVDLFSGEEVGETIRVVSSGGEK